MNVDLGLRGPTLVAVFTWTWLAGSVTAAAYFAFWLFPEIQAGRTAATVEIYFQTQNPSTIYYPNSGTYRKEFKALLSDKLFLYFSRCEVLPLSQRPNCDITRNWTKLEPSDAGCADVANCLESQHTFSESEKTRHWNDIRSATDSRIAISDPPPLSWSDPSGWGESAEWPLFFLSMFLAVKLGRSLGEFLFTSYNK